MTQPTPRLPLVLHRDPARGQQVGARASQRAGPGSARLVLDSLYDEDVVRRARHPWHMFKKSDAPRAGPVRQIELLAFHRLFVWNAIDVVLHDHRAIERSFADGPCVVRHVRILAGRGTDPRRSSLEAVFGNVR